MPRARWAWPRSPRSEYADVSSEYANGVPLLASLREEARRLGFGRIGTAKAILVSGLRTSESPERVLLTDVLLDESGTMAVNLTLSGAEKSFAAKSLFADGTIVSTECLAEDTAVTRAATRNVKATRHDDYLTDLLPRQTTLGELVAHHRAKATDVALARHTHAVRQDMPTHFVIRRRWRALSDPRHAIMRRAGTGSKLLVCLVGLFMARSSETVSALGFLAWAVAIGIVCSVVEPVVYVMVGPIAAHFSGKSKSDKRR